MKSRDKIYHLMPSEVDWTINEIAEATGFSTAHVRKVMLNLEGHEMVKRVGKQGNAVVWRNNQVKTLK